MSQLGFGRETGGGEPRPSGKMYSFQTPDDVLSVELTEREMRALLAQWAMEEYPADFDRSSHEALGAAEAKLQGALAARQ